jgi:ParB family chromosome partitioning protein
MKSLGRGLDALIQSAPENTDNSTGITTIRIDKIIPNRYQPRRVFHQDTLRELAASFVENGIIQPIIVTKKDNTEYELIAGERRLEAAKIANFKEVPVIIRSVSPKEQLQFALIENVQREDLNPIDEARAYQQLQNEFFLTQEQIAKLVGKERATISNFIRLLKLPESVREMVMKEELSSGHARAILQVQEEYQEKFAIRVKEMHLSVRQTESEARDIRQSGWKQKTEKKSQPLPFFKQIENQLKNVFTVKVKIAEKNDKGKISFYYSSPEEREKLLTLLTKKDD